MVHILYMSIYSYRRYSKIPEAGNLQRKRLFGSVLEVVAHNLAAPWHCVSGGGMYHWVKQDYLCQKPERERERARASEQRVTIPCEIVLLIGA